MVRQSVSPSVRQSVSPSVRQSVSPSVRQSASPPVRQSASPPVRQSASPSFGTSIFHGCCQYRNDVSLIADVCITYSSFWALKCEKIYKICLHSHFQTLWYNYSGFITAQLIFNVNVETRWLRVQGSVTDCCDVVVVQQFVNTQLLVQTETKVLRTSRRSDVTSDKVRRGNRSTGAQCYQMDCKPMRNITAVRTIHTICIILHLLRNDIVIIL